MSNAFLYSLLQYVQLGGSLFVVCTCVVSSSFAAECRQFIVYVFRDAYQAIAKHINNQSWPWHLFGEQRMFFADGDFRRLGIWVLRRPGRVLCRR
jgi:hypothetical protein